MGVLLKQGVKASITGCTTEHEYKLFEHMNCNIMIEGGKNILLCVVYSPPPSRSNGLRTSNFFSEWSTYLESLDKVLVDINFHLNNKSNPDTKAYLSLLEAHGVMQHITTPTHIKGHILDMVVTREGSCILRAEPDVFPSGVGDDAGHATLDHYAIGTHLQSRFPKPALKAITYRKTKTIPEFRESVRCAVLSQNVDNLVMTYNTDIGNVFDKYAPLIKKTYLCTQDCSLVYTRAASEETRVSMHGKSNAQKEKEFHGPIS